MSHPDFQPTLIGPSITIRPVSSDDWPQLFAAGSDPEIWKVHPVPDRYTEPAFKKFFDGAVDCKMALCSSTARPIGWGR
jgi:N-acetyltransferase